MQPAFAEINKLCIPQCMGWLPVSALRATCFGCTAEFKKHSCAGPEWQIRKIQIRRLGRV